MAKSELDKILKDLQGLTPKSKIATENYTAPRAFKEQALDPNAQKMKHRDYLIWLVVGLSGLSFLFLVCIISFQMCVRLYRPSYIGISDTVINIVAVSVFAQVIAVVATIARIIFKD